MEPEYTPVVLTPKGRLDAENAPKLDAEIKSALERSPDSPLILDFADLEYISSAGLRVLLTASNRLGKPLTVKNVSSEVYRILDMTGFTSFLNVERRLRSISIEGCEVIGYGTTATVYRIDPDTIIKVYAAPADLEAIRNEQRRAKQALLKGIPTAISYDAVRVGDRYGSVFELLNAKTFIDLIRAEPDRMDELVRRHVEVIRAIHAVEAEPGELPDSRELYLSYLDELSGILPGALRRELEKRFRAMPADLHLIHGDIHMKNVMLCKGEPVLIDMDKLSTGDAVFELANLFVAYRAFGEDDPENSLRFIGIPKEESDELMEKTLVCFLGDPDEETLRRTWKKVMTVGYVRFLYLVAVWHAGGRELADVRTRHAVGHLEKLLAEVDGFAL